jgi:hypothetical protein
VTQFRAMTDMNMVTLEAVAKHDELLCNRDSLPNNIGTEIMIL